MGKPFQPVERLPVPPDVAESFKRVRSADVGFGYSTGSSDMAKRSKALAKVAAEEADAAKHFGGDVGKMRTHFKRWTRWKGTAMSIPMTAASFAMDAAEDAMERAGERPADTIFGKDSPVAKRLRKPYRRLRA